VKATGGIGSATARDIGFLSVGAFARSEWPESVVDLCAVRRLGPSRRRTTPWAEFCPDDHEARVGAAILKADESDTRDCIAISEYRNMRRFAEGTN